MLHLRIDFSGEFYGEIDRGDHAVGARNSFARDLKRGAMIGTRARKRQAKRHIHAFVKCVKFQRDQSLIVIHAEHGIEFTFHCAMKNCVGGKRAGEDAAILIVSILDCSSDTAGAMISISSRPSLPDSPACGFSPATAMRGDAYGS